MGLLSLLMILLSQSQSLHTVSLSSVVLSHTFIDLIRTVMMVGDHVITGSLVLAPYEWWLTRSLLTHNSIAQAFLVALVVRRMLYLVLLEHGWVSGMVLIRSVVVDHLVMV